MKNFLFDNYLWIKSLHLIFVIAFMAGMMYLPRLFIYHHQAAKGGEAETFFIKMEGRLLRGILNPSIILLWVLGLLMLWLQGSSLMASGWFGVKFALTLLISGIHGFYAWACKKFARGERPLSEKQWRWINEAPFILMIAIVFLVIVKPF